MIEVPELGTLNVRRRKGDRLAFTGRELDSRSSLSGYNQRSRVFGHPERDTSFPRSRRYVANDGGDLGGRVPRGKVRLGIQPDSLDERGGRHEQGDRPVDSSVVGPIT